jgi:hypothetical protein
MYIDIQLCNSPSEQPLESPELQALPPTAAVLRCSNIARTASVTTECIRQHSCCTRAVRKTTRERDLSLETAAGKTEG